MEFLNSCQPWKRKITGCFFFGVCRKNCHTLLFYGKFRKQPKHCQEWFPFPIFRAGASKVVIASGSCDDQPGRRKASKYECESGILDKLQPRVWLLHISTLWWSGSCWWRKNNRFRSIGKWNLIRTWQQSGKAPNSTFFGWQSCVQGIICKIAGKRLAQFLAANSPVVPTTGPPSEFSDSFIE